MTSDHPGISPVSPVSKRDTASGSAPSHPLNLSPGTVLAERYRILGILGRGGMGMVYRADDLKLGQVVALKFLPVSFAQDKDRVERFHAEVRIARQVSHPNVCRVYDIGEVSGHYFLTMEYVDGEDLSTLLGRIGRLPKAKALEVAHELCAGLAAAHAKEVIHRDLKPANVMIDGRGHARITDFGLAVGAEENTGGEVAGTPAYMAPELFDGQPATVQSDLYALGLVLYELHTGRRPWEGKSLSDWRRSHTREDAPSPSSRAADMDPAVDRLILRCLEKNPASRPRTAMQVAAALPGSNPLAAAIAAGETPSPEMVAASGEEGTLRAVKAWTLLGSIVAGLLLIVFLAQRSTLTNLLPPGKSPEVLSEAARQIAARVGYADPPVDSAFWFGVEPGYRTYLAQIPAPERYHNIASEFPSPVQFWYRQSPRPMLTNFQFEVTATDPMPFYSNELRIGMDPAGRLNYFAAIGPQESEPSNAEALPDWRPLFIAADMEMAQVRPVEAKWLPDVPADRNFTWEATTHGEVLQIQGASYHNHIVFFRVVAPWARPERVTPTQASFAATFGTGLFIAAIFVSLTISLFFARRNLKQGRGDRQGAIRVVVVIFLVVLISFVGSHFVWNASWIFAWFQISAGLALTNALEFALFYVALEPYVRRTWPDILISWSRLVMGGWTDPLVGRDLMLGVLFGVGLVFTGYARLALPYWFPVAGITAGAPGSQSFREASIFLGNIAANILGVMDAIGSLAVVFLVAKITRSKAAGVIVLGVLFIASSLAGENLKVELVLVTMMVLFSITCLMRVGLLALFVARFVQLTLDDRVLTSDFSRWYAWRGLVELGVVLAIALYGFRVSLGGKPLFGMALED